MANQNQEQQSALSFFRLFSPMEGEVLEYQGDDNGKELTAYETVNYVGLVRKQLEQMDMGAEVLASSIQNPALRERIAGMRPTAEAYGGRLWGVLEVKTYGKLSSGEIRDVRAEWMNQGKSGWGKEFERQPIPIPQGQLHVRFHNGGPDYFLLMEQELKEQGRMRVTIAAEECNGKRGFERASVELPASRFELADALQRAHVPEGGGYEMQSFEGWPSFFPEYLDAADNKTLEEVNLLAAKMGRMDEDDLGAYEGALQLRSESDIEHPVTIKELINYAYNMDSFDFHPGVVNDLELGEIAMMGGMLDVIDDLSDEAADLLDARKVGEAMRRADQGTFIKSGYVFRSSSDWREVYDGIHLPEQLDAHDGVLSLRLESADSDPAQNSGVWLELPADEQAMRWALTSLGERSLEDCVIAEADGILPSLHGQLAGDEDIGMLNTLAERLAAFPDRKTLMKYKAVLELECYPNLDWMLDIAQNLGCYDFDTVATSYASYAEFLFHEAGIDLDDPAFASFDFKGYGKRQSEDSGYVMTEYGPISRNEEPFVPEYTAPRPGMTMT